MGKTDWREVEFTMVLTKFHDDFSYTGDMASAPNWNLARNPGGNGTVYNGLTYQTLQQDGSFGPQTLDAIDGEIPIVFEKISGVYAGNGYEDWYLYTKDIVLGDDDWSISLEIEIQTLAQSGPSGNTTNWVVGIGWGHQPGIFWGQGFDIRFQANYGFNIDPWTEEPDLGRNFDWARGANSIPTASLLGIHTITVSKTGNVITWGVDGTTQKIFWKVNTSYMMAAIGVRSQVVIYSHAYAGSPGTDFSIHGAIRDITIIPGVVNTNKFLLTDWTKWGAYLESPLAISDITSGLWKSVTTDVAELTPQEAIALAVTKPLDTTSNGLEISTFTNICSEAMCQVADVSRATLLQSSTHTLSGGNGRVGLRFRFLTSDVVTNPKAYLIVRASGVLGESPSLVDALVFGVGVIDYDGDNTETRLVFTATVNDVLLKSWTIDTDTKFISIYNGFASSRFLKYAALTIVVDVKDDQATLYWGLMDCDYIHNLQLIDTVAVPQTINSSVLLGGYSYKSSGATLIHTTSFIDSIIIPSSVSSKTSIVQKRNLIPRILAGSKDFEIQELQHQVLEIIDYLNGLMKTLETKLVVDGHIANTNNPHKTTVGQIGATPNTSFVSHVNDHDNPHQVTALQVDAYSTSQIDEALTVVDTALYAIQESLTALYPHYGEMHNENNDFTVTITAAEVDTEITGNMTAGILRGVTFDGEHYLKILRPGKYNAVWSISLEAVAGVNLTFEAGVMVNGIRVSRGGAHAETPLGGTGRPMTLSATLILDLVFNDEVSLCIHNHTTDDDAVINHASLVLTELPTSLTM